jgi:hypothetical protein
VFVALLGPPARASIIATYNVDAGGSNTNPLNGLAASGDFSTAGTQLTVTLQNTSTGAPVGFDSAASLLVSLGFNLPSDVTILSGDTATIAVGSVGIGSWSALGPGDSVASQWLWTNNYGGDLMVQGGLLSSRQVVSTSSGQGTPSETLFGGGSPNVDGPFGGMAANPLTVSLPPTQPAVQTAITFQLTLSRALTSTELSDVASGGVVEFGSDVRYLKTGIPEPTTATMLAAGLALLARRRLSTRAD